MSTDVSKRVASAVGINSSVSSLVRDEKTRGPVLQPPTQQNVMYKSFCQTTQNHQVNDSIYRKSFVDNLLAMDGVRNVAGPVGDGLASLMRTSDILRVGGNGSGEDPATQSTLSRIANTAAGAVEQGANVVLDTVGLGSVDEVIGDINPKAVNSAYSSASGLFTKVKSGRLGINDLPQLSADFTNVFGLMQGALPGAKGKPIAVQRAIEKCGASPYAVDLVNAAPKHKFLYIIDIDFSPEYIDWNDIGKSMAFSTKRSSRPQVDFEYEEINMYNFRTRVPKRTSYQPMTMVFHDDQTNNSHLFYTAYMRAMSPLANIQTPDQFRMAETDGMGFGKNGINNTFGTDSTPTRGYSGSLGSLNGNSTSLIQEIRLYHVFDYGKLMNVYHFHNPRITSLTPSELSMAETGEGSEFEFQFVYDGLWVAPAVDIEKEMNAPQMGNNYNISKLSGHGPSPTYTLNPEFGPGYDVNTDKMMYNAPTFQNNNGSSYDSRGPGPSFSSGNIPDIPGVPDISNADSNFTSGIEGVINDVKAAAEPYVEGFNTLKNDAKAAAEPIVEGYNSLKDSFNNFKF